MKNVLKKLIPLTLAFILTGCGFLGGQVSSSIDIVPSDTSTSSETDSSNDSSTSSSDSSTESEESSSDESTSSETSSSSTQPGVLVTSVTLSSKSITVGVNESKTLRTSVKPSTATNPTLSWTSSLETVATVDSAGKITGVSKGTAVITASATDGSGKYATCTVTVKDYRLENIVLSSEAVSIDPGETRSVSYSFVPSTTDYNTVTATSSDTSVFTCTLNENQQTVSVKGVGHGTATLTVKSKSKTTIYSQCAVSVNEILPSAISFSAASYEVDLGGSYQLNPTFTPSNTTNKSVTYSSSNTAVATVSSSGLVTGNSKGSAVITVKTVNGKEATATINVVEPSYSKTPVTYTIADVNKNNYYTIDSCPTTGNVRTLVIPIWFTDSTNYITSANKANVLDDIRIAFNGTKEEVGGYESVKTYYETLSKGALTYNATIADWYETNQSTSTYKSESTGQNNTISLVTKASNAYFTKNTSDSRKNYDADKDGYLDSVILIYAAPDYSAGNFGSSASNLWAYCYWLQDSSTKNTTTPGANTFMWASYDFMYGSNAKSRAGSSYSSGVTTYTTIDAHTYIHETGHLLGLNDYYDYSDKGYTPLGAFSMQDYNVGSHDPYSAMIMGYANPYVVTGSTNITIKDFQSSRDVVLISSSYSGSPFNEYILLELYTPTGLNEFDTVHRYGSYPQGVNKAGIRIYHIDARLAAVSGNSCTITDNPKSYGEGVLFLNSNSYSSDYENFDGVLNQSEAFLMRKSTTVTYTPTDTFSSSCLFTDGDVFTLSKYKSQFVKGTTLNNGKTWPFTVTINSVSSTSASITITKN